MSGGGGEGRCCSSLADGLRPGSPWPPRALSGHVFLLVAPSPRCGAGSCPGRQPPRGAPP